MEKLLSVIVPSYNMEAYIERSVRSLLIKKNLELLEILIINDGSIDTTSEKSHSLEKEYPSVIKVIDKENGNYGSCINIGLQNASGKYIRILDADDYYDTDAFNLFIETLKNIESDVVLSDFSIIQENKRQKQKVLSDSLSNRYLSFDSIKIPCGNIQMHGITYKTQLLRNIHYKQSEGISYTDQEWILFPFFFINNLYYIPFDIYQYCLGREGQTMNPTIKAKKINDSLEGTICSLIYYHNNKNKISSNKRNNYILTRITSRVIYLYNAYLILQDNNSFDEHACKKLDTALKDYAPNIYQATSKKWLRKYIPYKYIDIWRKFGIRVPNLFKYIL